MKNKYWILIFGAILALCLVLVLLPTQNAPSELAQIKYGSKTTTVDLRMDQEMVFESADGGYNAVTVKDGKIAVTEANCPH